VKAILDTNVVISGSSSEAFREPFSKRGRREGSSLLLRTPFPDAGGLK
jgi:hypothetical protein